MSDVEQYMNGRKQTKLEYTVGFEEGNRDFEIDLRDRCMHATQAIRNGLRLWSE